MGIDQPRLLSDAERDEIAGALAQTTPADRPAIIADLRARYGAEANMLATELTGGREGAWQGNTITMCV